MTDLSEAKDVVGKISSWVQDQGKKQSKRSSPWQWVSGLFVTAIAFIGIGIAYWKARKAGKELAKLKHEKDVAEQEKERGELANKIAKTDAKIASLKEKGQQAESSLEKIDQKLKDLEENATRTKKAINALKNWDDVDRYLAERNRSR